MCMNAVNKAHPCSDFRANLGSCATSTPSPYYSPRPAVSILNIALVAECCAMKPPLPPSAARTSCVVEVDPRFLCFGHSSWCVCEKSFASQPFLDMPSHPCPRCSVKRRPRSDTEEFYEEHPMSPTLRGIRCVSVRPCVCSFACI